MERGQQVRPQVASLGVDVPLSRAFALFSEFLQRCLSRVRTALAIDVMRFGLHRDLRKIRQDFTPELRDRDVRHLDQQPGGLARCASRAITRSVATSKKLNERTRQIGPT